MKSSSIPPDIWDQARDDWISSGDTVAAIAARNGMTRGTLYRRAKAEGWPPRGSSNPVAVARQLYDAITAELRVSLQSLQAEGQGEATATASQRAPLIRAHRRALIAVLDATKPLAPRSSRAPKAAPESTSFPALDLDAARQDVLDRLARLDRAPPADLAPDPDTTDPT